MLFITHPVSNSNFPKIDLNRGFDRYLSILKTYLDVSFDFYGFKLIFYHYENRMYACLFCQPFKTFICNSNWKPLLINFIATMASKFLTKLLIYWKNIQNWSISFHYCCPRDTMFQNPEKLTWSLFWQCINMKKIDSIQTLRLPIQESNLRALLPSHVWMVMKNY